MEEFAIKVQCDGLEIYEVDNLFGQWRELKSPTDVNEEADKVYKGFKALYPQGNLKVEVETRKSIFVLTMIIYFKKANYYDINNICYEYKLQAYMEMEQKYKQGLENIKHNKSIQNIDTDITELDREGRFKQIAHAYIITDEEVEYHWHLKEVFKV